MSDNKNLPQKKDSAEVACLVVSFPNSSLGMPIAKLRLVYQQTKQVYLYAQHQAELEGRHSQAELHCH